MVFLFHKPRCESLVLIFFFLQWPILWRPFHCVRKLLLTGCLICILCCRWLISFVLARTIFCCCRLARVHPGGTVPKGIERAKRLQGAIEHFFEGDIAGIDKGGGRQVPSLVRNSGKLVIIYSYRRSLCLVESTAGQQWDDRPQFSVAECNCALRDQLLLWYAKSISILLSSNNTLPTLRSAAWTGSHRSQLERHHGQNLRQIYSAYHRNRLHQLCSPRSRVYTAKMWLFRFSV